MSPVLPQNVVRRAVRRPDARIRDAGRPGLTAPRSEPESLAATEGADHPALAAQAIDGAGRGCNG